jgi:hypothetical protein
MLLAKGSRAACPKDGAACSERTAAAARWRRRGQVEGWSAGEDRRGPKQSRQPITDLMLLAFCGFRPLSCLAVALVASTAYVSEQLTKDDR